MMSESALDVAPGQAVLTATGQRLAQEIFRSKPVDTEQVRIKGARANSEKEGGSHGAGKAVNGDGKTSWISDADPGMPVTLTAFLDGPYYVSMVSIEVRTPRIAPHSEDSKNSKHFRMKSDLSILNTKINPNPNPNPTLITISTLTLTRPSHLPVGNRLRFERLRDIRRP